MITTAQTAAILTEKLNALAERTAGFGYRFAIYSNEAEYKASVDGTQKTLPTPLINGILLDVMSTPIPLEKLNSYVKQENLQFILPVDPKSKSNGIDYAMNVLTAFVQDAVGLSGTIEDPTGSSFSYVLGLSTPMTGVETYYGIGHGRAVPVSISVAWQFIENGVLSNNAKFTLNGTQLILIDGSIVRTRVGETNNIEDREEMTTIITQQGLTIKVVIPYKRGDVSQTLMNDMIKGTLGTVYLLGYDDGAVSNTWTMVAKEITGGFNPGKGIIITATLEIARDTEVI